MTYFRNSALLFIIVGFTIFVIWWSNQVELDEFARMQGSVIPSTKEKVIQSEFPGLTNLNKCCCWSICFRGRYSSKSSR